MFIVADNQNAGGRVVSFGARDVCIAGRIAIGFVRARGNSAHVASKRVSVVSATSSECMIPGSVHTISDRVHIATAGVVFELGTDHRNCGSLVSISARVHAREKNIGMTLAFAPLVRARVREARSSAIIIRAGTCPGHLRLLRRRTVV